MRPLEEGDPQQVGGYRLLGRLGAGAMGEVFYAQSRSARPLAIKVVHADLAMSPEFRARFAREVAAMRTVGGFWTAAVVDADAQARRPWLACEYIAGPSLAQALADGPLDAPLCGALLVRLAEALSSIHRAGLVHRDLKPSNVILGRDGPKVIDFGISRLAAAGDQTLSHGVAGTPAYMAPEQVLGDGVGPASDVWALAATIVFAASGHGPFDGPDVASINQAVLMRPPNLEGVPPALAPLLMSCLDKDPSVRPSAEQLLATVPGQAGAVKSRFGDWRPPEHAPVFTRGQAGVPPVAGGDLPGTTITYQPPRARLAEPLAPTRLDDRTSWAPPDVAKTNEITPDIGPEVWPWQSPTLLLTAMAVIQVILGLAVVARDVVTGPLLAKAQQVSGGSDVEQIGEAVVRLRVADAVLFVMAFATAGLVAAALVHAAYQRRGWRVWVTVTGGVVLFGYAVNAVDLFTRAVTGEVFGGFLDAPKWVLDQQTVWYSAMDTCVTLLMLVSAALVMVAVHRDGHSPPAAMQPRPPERLR